MKSILFAIFMMAVVTISISFARAEEIELSSEGFKITRVMNEPKTLNALGKMAQFSDSNEVGKQSELNEKLPPEEQGEEFVIDWRYSGKAEGAEAAVKLEYVTGKKAEIQVYEKVYTSIKKKTYQIILRNVGKTFRKNGEIAHWRVTIISDGKIVASKQSALWSAFENYVKGTENRE